MLKDGLLHIKFHIFLFLLEPKMWILLWTVLMSQFKRITTTRTKNNTCISPVSLKLPHNTYCRTVTVSYWKLIKSSCTLANSEDQDEMSCVTAFHCGPTVCLEKNCFQTEMHHTFACSFKIMTHNLCVSSRSQTVLYQTWKNPKSIHRV